MCGSFLKPFPCLLNAFFVFSVSLRDLQIAAMPEAVCRYLGRWSWAKNLTNLNQLWILTHTLCIRSVGNKQLQRLQQLFRKSWITDLASETEMSRDWTNMEHRYEVEGSTWAGVCRSWGKKGKNSNNNEVLKRHHLWLCTAQKGRDPWRDNQPLSWRQRSAAAPFSPPTGCCRSPDAPVAAVCVSPTADRKASWLRCRQSQAWEEKARNMCY